MESATCGLDTDISEWHNPPDMTRGEVIAKRRAEVEWTQTDLAVAASVSKDTVRRAEGDDKRIKPSTYRKLERALTEREADLASQTPGVPPKASPLPIQETPRAATTGVLISETDFAEINAIHARLFAFVTRLSDARERGRREAAAGSDSGHSPSARKRLSAHKSS